MRRSRTRNPSSTRNLVADASRCVTTGCASAPSRSSGRLPAARGRSPHSARPRASCPVGRHVRRGSPCRRRAGPSTVRPPTLTVIAPAGLGAPTARTRMSTATRPRLASVRTRISGTVVTGDRHGEGLGRGAEVAPVPRDLDGQAVAHVPPTDRVGGVRGLRDASTVAEPLVRGRRAALPDAAGLHDEAAATWAAPSIRDGRTSTTGLAMTGAVSGAVDLDFL